MQGITDAIKSLTGNEHAYPAKQFTSGFTPYPDPSMLLEQEDQNKAGERPGKQSKQRLTAIDDIYADGKPYVGSGKLAGKKAIISGGDSGIGRAIAILYALEGADSTIAYLPSEQQDAEDVKKYIEEKTGGQRTVHCVPGDLKSEANNITLIESHMARFGSLDILVPNAAQQLENHDITSLDSKQWEETFQINIHHYFYMTKHAIKHMPRGSAIVMMASINAYIGRPDLLDYTSTKGAIISLMRGVSNQIVGDKQVRVNAIAPGPIYTPLVTSTFSKSNLTGLSSPPMGRPGQPVEVATVAVFLASQDSSYISGQCIHTNGGTVIN